MLTSIPSLPFSIIINKFPLAKRLTAGKKYIKYIARFTMVFFSNI